MYDISQNRTITVANGDGIGPEIMNSVMHILKESEARITIETINIGEELYNRNYISGIAPDSWDSLERTKILLKSPITTPQGGGYKSLNVTIRKALGLYANIRPSISYHPYINTLHPNLNTVIIRENEEDLYAGIEYRHTRNMRESLKLVSKTGCEKIIRYAFEYALRNNRKKVTCFSKDNIMKFSDGIFHQVFEEIAKEYPKIISEHYIVDIGTAKLATIPDKFDVIVTSNLFGDIISDITGEISGSIGMAGSANIGENYAMFEAIHGSAPDISGKDIANPSGLLNATIMMLVHIGHIETAELIENSWKKTIEDGIHTPDIYNEKNSKKKVGTKEFTKSVIKNLGSKPSKLKPANYNSKQEVKNFTYNIDISEEKTLVGVDIYVDMHCNSAEKVAIKINPIDGDRLILKTISSKGLKLWPRDDEYISESDHWCCRFMPDFGKIEHSQIVSLLQKLSCANIDFVKVENLYNFNGKRGYSLSQGE